MGGVAAACANAGPGVSAGTSTSAGTGPSSGTFNWMTWSDHFYEAQLDRIKQGGITPSIAELLDNAEGFAKVKEVKGQLDLISGDALWVPRYFEEGLIDAVDINEFDVAKQLYSLARDFQIWSKPEGYLGYPFGWSPIVIAYNPKFVDPAPDSWEVLLDPKYKGRVIMENNPVEVVAQMGKTAGVDDPYNMTDDELATAKDFLITLRPNILKLAQQVTEVVTALANEEAWIAPTNLGVEDRVKDAGGPEVKAFVPAEGTVGWMDAEMTVKEGANKSLVKPFLEQAEQAEYVAENFLQYGRPLFNERAYRLLVDKGQQERADRYLYNKPETVLAMKLRGPGLSTEKAIQTFNEVFGA